MIKTAFQLFLFCFLTVQVFGQYVLETPDGKSVMLNSNGTWHYVKADENNKKNLAVPKASTANYIDKYKKFTIWYDPTQWFIEAAKTNDAFEWDAIFYSKDQAITGYCMASRLTMPVEELEIVMKQQWQQAGKITSFTSYKDTLNDLPVTGFDMMLEFGGVTYQYKGYIHSTLRGSFQFIVGTQKEIFEEDKKKIDLLFKGLNKL